MAVEGLELSCIHLVRRLSRASGSSKLSATDEPLPSWDCSFKLEQSFQQYCDSSTTLHLIVSSETLDVQLHQLMWIWWMPKRTPIKVIVIIRASTHVLAAAHLHGAGGKINSRQGLTSLSAGRDLRLTVCGQGPDPNYLTTHVP